MPENSDWSYYQNDSYRAPEREGDYQSPFSGFERFGQDIDIDLRRWGFVSPIRDQGNCLSCTSYGLAASYETRKLSSDGGQVEVNARRLYNINFGQPCTNGYYLSKAAKKSKNIQSLPMRSGGPLTGSGLEQFSYDEEVIFALEMSIAVAVEMFIDESFEFWASWDFYNSPPTGKSHVATIIGAYQSQSNGTGYWILKNSYGTGFGRNGFFRVRFGDCGILRSWYGYGAVSGAYDSLKVDDTEMS